MAALRGRVASESGRSNNCTMIPKRAVVNFVVHSCESREGPQFESREGCVCWRLLWTAPKSRTRNALLEHMSLRTASLLGVGFRSQHLTSPPPAVVFISST